MADRVREILICMATYAAALAGSVVIVGWLHGRHPLVVASAADAVATIVVFLFSFAFRNSSLYDPYWSVAPIFLAGYWILAADAGADSVRQGLVFALVLAWGLRLTWNWLSGWRGLSHEDWRYIDLQERSGKLYWLVSFFGIHLFPTALVFLGCLSVYAATVKPGRSFDLLDLVAGAVTGAAIALEAISDRQLRQFQRRRTSPDEIMTLGVWRWSRHPNYLGEVLFWWGLFLFAVTARPAYWWTVSGPISITLLFVFVSVPMMDQRLLARRPAYAHVIDRIPALFPLFRPGKKSF